MIDAEILNEQEKLEITETQIQLIEQVVQEAAKLEDIQEGEVVITFVNDEQIHELNQSYRGIDRPTDVLSFAISEKGRTSLRFYLRKVAIFQ